MGKFDQPAFAMNESIAEGAKEMEQLNIQAENSPKDKEQLIAQMDDINEFLNAMEEISGLSQKELQEEYVRLSVQEEALKFANKINVSPKIIEDIERGSLSSLFLELHRAIEERKKKIDDIEISDGVMAS
ncbi:MAG: hypothetical protein U9Q12_02155 [Patescibacteria group bacterium]|nr:hypothetical protein [Patescibacteria group bacterium]